SPAFRPLAFSGESPKHALATSASTARQERREASSIHFASVCGVATRQISRIEDQGRLPEA
ncbi:MAG: hypothetical protein L0323_12660, partial [Planctomycetes bacterium]|nr:hypothetical protein [Planctomycetota bacterium]